MRTTKTVAAYATLALACALTLTGCSNGGATNETATTAAADSGGGAPDAGDACALLTGSDVTGVLGVAFDEAKHNDELSGGAQDICEWWASDGSVAFVQVLVLPGAGQFATQRGSAAEVMGDLQDVTVPGASSAYAVASGSILGMSMGDTFVQVSNITTSSDDVTDQTVALATIVAGNL